MVPLPAELPVISWSEFQRRVKEDKEELILVAGCVIDVSELQEGEHKGGAIYNLGADMTNLFMGTHANPPDRQSVHVEDFRVVENIQDKVNTWTVALLDESTRPNDPKLIKLDLDGIPGYTESASTSGKKNLATKSTDVDPGGRKLTDSTHPWWVPSKIKEGTTITSETSIAAAPGRDAAAILQEKMAGLSSGIAQRCFGAIVGYFVSDAAAQPSHWVYEVPRLTATLRNRGIYDRPEFVSPALNAFYSLPIGNRSCYGDQAWVLMKHLVDSGNSTLSVTPQKLEAEFTTAFDVNGSLGYGAIDGTLGLTQENMPIDGPWRHGSIKGFVELHSAGIFYLDESPSH